jgi:hypothetical protein
MNQSRNESTRRLPWIAAILSLAGLCLAIRPGVSSVSAVDDGCPVTSSETEHQGTTLQGFAGSGVSGVIYDGNDQNLKLNKQGGVFKAATIGITDNHNVSCSADFDGDSWTDLVVGQSHNNYIYFYKNRTVDNPAPDWADPSAIRTPKFVRITTVHPASATGTQHAGMVCGDFNGDARQDFLYYKAASETLPPSIQRMYLGNGDGTFQAPYAPMIDPLLLPIFNQTSTNAFAYDYNKDGWLDVIYGGKKAVAANTGTIVALLNNCPTAWAQGATCGAQPQFTAADIITGKNFGAKGINALAGADFTGDGLLDLLAGSPSQCSNFSLWPGLPGGGFAAVAQSVPSVGGASTLAAADFSLDGKPDMVWGRDGHNCTTQGGKAYYYTNNGSSTPFSGGFTTQLSEYNVAVPGTGVAMTDYDLGTTLDYDHDPDGTIDAIIADGNDSGQYLLFANRVVGQYVACGDVASGILDLGPLEDSEMVVTGARMHPTANLPSDTSIKYFLSNEDPANWQLASACADDPDDYCVSFPSTSGRSIRWKATMCSNELRSQTPTLSDVTINFDYTPAKEHFRGGVVVDDGVAYVGAFKQPGDRGHFYAANAGLTEIYWDAGPKLDAMIDSARRVYTAAVGGASRLDFTSAATSQALLQTALGVASAAQADAVVTWQRSARFGIAGGPLSKTRLGAVQTSTPAVISPPTRPSWYQYLTTQEKQEVDVFVEVHKSRPVLALFGSKDGPLHAILNQPSDIQNAANGVEKWAFLPSKVTSRLLSDKTGGVVSAFVDGSPTLADVKLADGRMHTVAVVSGGVGSGAVFALDVTDTVSAAGVVSGPLPLWELLPGEELAGLGTSKPAIARVKIDGAEKFIAILATGYSNDNVSPPYEKGRDVWAVDLTTGARMWRFRTACPVTADPVVLETDDDLEPSAPAIDGYVDRLVLADACGFVYKLDPAVSLPGALATDGWLDSTALGAVATGTTDAKGRAVKALFSTALTSGALGEERPIAGTLGTRADSSGRVILFFGTGGLESYDPTKQNEFYAVYADTGVIRNKLTGTCTNNKCEKFYGGVAVSAEQVLLTRSTDPTVGTGLCELGSSEVMGVDLDDLTTQLTIATTSSTVSSLFGHAGAIYFTTLGGDMVRVGTPGAADAGGESATGGHGGDGGGDGGDDDGNSSMPLGIVGWRQVL